MKYFLTVDWCNQGKRGIFCDELGRAFPSDDKPHAEHEMFEILGMFCMVLSPKSEPMTAKTVKKYTVFRPLGEYKSHYGIAMRKESA